MPTDTKPYNNLGDGTRTNLLFGEWLVERGLIGDEQLRAALAEQKRSGERLGWILVQQKCLTESQLTEALSAALSVEHLALDDLSVIDKEIARQVPENIAKRFGLIAIGGAATVPPTITASIPVPDRNISSIRFMDAISIRERTPISVLTTLLRRFMSPRSSAACKAVPAHRFLSMVMSSSERPKRTWPYSGR